MRPANASRKLAAGSVSFRDVLFRQFVDDDLGCASYLIGDPSKGEAFLVDPAYAIEQYLGVAREANVRIRACPRDDLRRSRVRARTARARARGAGLRPSARRARVSLRAAGRRPGTLGRFRVATCDPHARSPGWSTYCAFVVANRLVLTGDSLFIGDAARPDLAIEVREGAEGLFHSLQRLKELPDADPGLPRPRRRLALRGGYEPRSLLDDRQREAHERKTGIQ